jgi:hypothetical protein
MSTQEQELGGGRQYLKGETGISFDINVIVYKQYLNEQGHKLPEDIWQDFQSFTINVPEIIDAEIMATYKEKIETLMDSLEVEKYQQEGEINWDTTEVGKEQQAVRDKNGTFPPNLPDMTDKESTNEPD